jgi:hypothetical protein
MATTFHHPFLCEYRWSSYHWPSTLNHPPERVFRAFTGPENTKDEVLLFEARRQEIRFYGRLRLRRFRADGTVAEREANVPRVRLPRPGPRRGARDGR